MLLQQKPSGVEPRIWHVDYTIRSQEFPTSDTMGLLQKQIPGKLLQYPLRIYVATKSNVRDGISFTEGQ